MKKTLLFITISLGLVACGRPFAHDLPTTDSSEAVINGQPKTQRDSIASRSVVLVELLTARGTPLTFCSGTLIGPHTVLTAGHCFDPQLITGVAGFRVLFENTYNLWGRNLERKGLGYVKHSDYNTTKFYDHDIAVGIFEGDIPAGFNTVAIDEDPKANYANELIYAYGYGRTQDYTGTRGESLLYSTGTLHRGVMKIMANYNIYEDRYFTLENWPTHLCQGDSGGPQFYDKNGVLKVIGVNSASYGDKLPNGIQSCMGKSQATKVARFAGWIRQQEKRLLESRFYH